MLQKVISLTEEYDMLPRGSIILCAVSGGKDSICLLHLLKQMERQQRFQVVAAHFNHQLRGAEADRDAAFVAHQCALWDIPVLTERGDVRAAAAESGKGIEETARVMRYAFLARAAQSVHAARIATAHNADDNAETLLLHLARGAGLQGLTGIPPRRGEIVRPLLTTGRAEIEAYLMQYGIPHVEDRSNADESFSRNKLRAQVMPVLWALNPQFIAHSAETIALLRADNDYLNARAAEVCCAARWAEDDLVIEAQHVAEQPAALAPRVVRRLLETQGDGFVSCSAAHLNAVVALARGDDPSAQISLPGGRLVQRVYRELLFTVEEEPLPPFAPMPLAPDGETAPPGTPWRVCCRAAVCPADASPSSAHFYLAQAGIIGDLLLRPRAVGDALTLPRRTGHKSIKKLMIDAKIPRRTRERIPVLADGAGVLALAGFGCDAPHLAAPGQAALELTFSSEVP